MMPIAFSANLSVPVENLGNPWFGVGLGSFGDASATIFTNRIDQSRSFRFPGYSDEDMIPFRDQYGNLTSFPAGVTSVEQLIWAQTVGTADTATQVNATMLNVEYRLTWTGGPATCSTSSSGMTLTYNSDRNYTVTFTTNGNKTITWSGGLPADVVLVEVAQIANYNAGVLYNPAYSDRLVPFRTIRFMDWMGTNFSKETSWANRTTALHRKQEPCSVEYMVALANLTGCDPWFCFGHLWDEDYVRNFVTYVRNNLDATLIPRFELSNEVWNFTFGQFAEVQNAGEAYYGTNSDTAYINYHAMRSTRLMRIVAEVYGTNKRYLRVLAWGKNQFNTTLLDAPLWATSDPSEYTNPAASHDIMSVSSYFGNDITGGASGIAIYNDFVANGTASAVLVALSYVPSELADTKASMQTWANEAFSRGMRMEAYEGGQHISLVETSHNVFYRHIFTVPDGNAFTVGETVSQAVTGTIASKTATTIVVTTGASSDIWNNSVSVVGSTSGQSQVPTGLSASGTSRTFTVPDGNAFTVGETVTQTLSAAITAKTATTIEINVVNQADWTRLKLLTSPSVPSGQTASALVRNDPKDGVVELLEAVNYSAAMATHLATNRQNMLDVGFTGHCEFTDLGAAFKSGFWGAQRGLEDENPRWLGMLSDLADNPRAKALRGARDVALPTNRYSAYGITGLTETSTQSWNAKGGTTLTAAPTGLLGTETLSYSWRVNGVERATGQTLALTVGGAFPAGATLTCVTTINGTPYTSRGVLIVA